MPTHVIMQNNQVIYLDMSGEVNNPHMLNSGRLHSPNDKKQQCLIEHFKSSVLQILIKW